MSLGLRTRGGESVQWIGDGGPDPIPASLLDRIMYWGSPTTDADGSPVPVVHDGPQAHLALQGASTTELPTHFHGVEQFQLFVRGFGTVGRHSVHAGVVHYSDRHTVYGPLRPGPEGMAYATLRARHDPGASFMPGARDHLAECLAASSRPAADRRNIALDLRTTLDPTRGRTTDWVDLRTDDDELRIAVVDLAGHQAAPSTPVGGAGAFVAVVEGAVDDPACPHQVGALAWQEPGTVLDVAAADHGARVALLQFPVLLT